MPVQTVQDDNHDKNWKRKGQEKKKIFRFTGYGGNEKKIRAPLKQMPTRNSKSKAHDGDEKKSKCSQKNNRQY